jgi:outer membrane lipoprotein-sorting protein
MKKLLLLLVSCFIFFPSFAQNDEESVKILEKFSSVALSAPSVSIKFKIITLNLPEKSTDTTAGYLLMAKDQYRLEMPDNITWFNGNISWNYLIAEKEVTIVKPGKKDDSFLSRPSSIFTLYKKGYKTRLIEENAKSWIIDLYPEETTSDLVRIRLTIGKQGSTLDGAEYKRKDGITLFLVVNEYNLKIRPAVSDFVFNQSNFKGVEIIDMR